MRIAKLVILFFITSATACFSQTDSSKQEVRADTNKIAFFSGMWSHHPQSTVRAGVYSAVLPGLGQAYNGKYWKIPIVYAALGTSGYFIYYWNSFYQDLRDAYILRTDGDSLTVDTQYGYIVSDETLLQYVDATKRYNDLLWIVTGAIYMLNIIDAVVDAHLYDFDVSDDLSLHIQPYFHPRMPVINSTVNAYGIQLNFALK